MSVDDSRLPGWPSVLAVVAHPDDESFGLGAVLGAFVDAGARAVVLCFTRGEASTLHGAAGELAEIRAKELAAAATALGVEEVCLLDYPDGRLSESPMDELIDQVDRLVARTGASGLLAFDPSGVTGHWDHQRATAVAMMAARRNQLPVLGWTLPAAVADVLNGEFNAAFSGHPEPLVDLVVDVDRARQYAAVRCHPSQALPASALWRRLELLGNSEHLRQLS